jgi:hypothetical protein
VAATDDKGAVAGGGADTDHAGSEPADGERGASNPGGLNDFEEMLDGIVNPNATDHPVLHGIMGNLSHRGEAVVDGFSHDGRTGGRPPRRCGRDPRAADRQLR